MADLLERLARGPVICAEGYLFELERRGYLQAGGFVPEVVLEHPEKVAELHREFVHAGSDVVEAFTYYAHREKLRVIGREDAWSGSIAGHWGSRRRSAAERVRCSPATSATPNVWAGDATPRLRARDVRGAGGVGGRGGCRLRHRRDVLLARRSAARHCRHQGGGTPRRGDADRAPPRRSAREGISPAEACRQLEDAGADVVGLNCGRGPATMLPLLEEVRRAVTVPVAGLPVPYRTTESHPTFHSLEDPDAPDPRSPRGRFRPRSTRSLLAI